MSGENTSQWKPSWIYSSKMVDTNGWKPVPHKGRVYYYNSKTKQSVWTKPNEIKLREEKLQEWETELAKDPVWRMAKDRFKRDVYINKVTKEKTFDKPKHWWTQDEIDFERKINEGKQRVEDEKRRKRKEARWAKIKPRIRKAMQELKSSLESSVPASVDKLKKKSEHPMFPCFGMSSDKKEEITSFFESDPLKQCYDARRVDQPPKVKIVGSQLIHAIFMASRRCDSITRRNKFLKGIQWPIRVVTVIARFCIGGQLKYENFITIPFKPADFSLNRWYFEHKSYLPDDRKFSGYDDRRVAGINYIIAYRARQKELEASDASKKPICSNAKWIAWWKKKAKLKAAEMMRLMKMRDMGYDATKDKYAFEYWEDIEGVDPHASDEGDTSSEDEQEDGKINQGSNNKKTADNTGKEKKRSWEKEQNKL